MIAVIAVSTLLAATPPATRADDPTTASASISVSATIPSRCILVTDFDQGGCIE